MFSVDALRDHALTLGFDLCGVAPVAQVARLDYLRDWIAKGYAGDLHFLTRTARARMDPTRVLPGARSAVVTGTIYHTDEPLSIAGYLAARSALWSEIVTAHGLRPLALDELLGESHHYADLCFAHGASRPPAPTFVSTVRIRQAGFTEVCNTEASVCHWLEDLMARRILPPRG